MTEFETAFRALATNNPPVAVAPASTVAVAPLPIQRLPLAWRLPAPPPSAWGGAVVEAPRAELPPVEFEWASETIRYVGTVVHKVLQRIGREGLAAWDAARVRRLQPVFAQVLAEEGVPPAQRETAVARVERALLQTLDDPRGRWILDAGHAESRCELPLSGTLKGEIAQVILDRTFVDRDGTRWIIDYKTSAHEGGGVEEFLDRERVRYAPQLERYGLVLAQMESRPIRLGLYFPLLDGWREWAPTP